MLQTVSNNYVEYASAGIAALIGLVFWLQKIFKDWKVSTVENSVITIMHNELDRMAKHNGKLTEELNKLQLEIVSLNQELRKLINENQNLFFEVGSLTKEVTRLHQLLTFYKMEEHE